MFVFEMVTLGSGTVTQGSNPVAPEPAQVALQVFGAGAFAPGRHPRARSPSSSAVAPVVSESVAQLAWARERSEVVAFQPPSSSIHASSDYQDTEIGCTHQVLHGARIPVQALARVLAPQRVPAL